MHAPTTGAPTRAPSNIAEPSANCPDLAQRAREIQIAAKYVDVLIQAAETSLEPIRDTLRATGPQILHAAGEWKIVDNLLHLARKFSRDMLAEAGTIELCAPTPAKAIEASPFRSALARYRAAERDFGALPSETEAEDPLAFKVAEDAYQAALQVLEAAPCSSWDEFADAFELACGDGLVVDGPLAGKLLADVRRLRIV